MTGQAGRQPPTQTAAGNGQESGPGRSLLATNNDGREHRKRRLATRNGPDGNGKRVVSQSKTTRSIIN